MRDIYTCDCETDPFKKGRVEIKPFIWGLYSPDFYKEFDKTEYLVNYLKDKEWVVYAHNGGKFDWLFLKDYIPEFQNITVINGRLSKFNIGLCEFRDSYNILTVHLAAYQKDQFDYTILEREVRYLPENIKKIKEYLHNDCKYLYELVIGFINDYGFKLTLPSTAMNFWSQTADRDPPKSTPDFYNKFKKFYFGGRVECFKKGLIKQDFKVIDINSAYPFAMMSRHPISLDFIESQDFNNINGSDFITLECKSDGAFPFRDRPSDPMTFPSGERKTFNVTGWELLGALENNLISEVNYKSRIIFTELTDFGDYINHFYELKKAAKKLGKKNEYLYAKLFMNSLYGKFAANPQNYKEYMIVESKNIQAAESEGYSYSGDFGLRSVLTRGIDESKQVYYNVATSASITGFVRAYLLGAICKVENPLYCDTDSIACENTGDLEIDSTKLGAWDMEAECDFGAIGGKKMYAFKYKNSKNKWKTASKGVKLSPAQLVRVAKGYTVEYESEVPIFSMTKEPRLLKRSIKMT